MRALIIFLLLFGIPVAEIALFIQVGDLIGLWPTLGCILLTAVVGTFLVRAQGIAILGRIQAETQQGRLPVGELISGACLVVAGLLLVTPGFLTDFLGFCLLIPFSRTLLGTTAVAAMMKNSGSVHFTSASYHGHARGPGGPYSSDTIDGEYTVVEPDDPAESRDDNKPAPSLEDRNSKP